MEGVDSVWCTVGAGEWLIKTPGIDDAVDDYLMTSSFYTARLNAVALLSTATSIALRREISVLAEPEPEPEPSLSINAAISIYSTGSIENDLR